MSDFADKETMALKLEAIEKETRSFVCPRCNAHLQFLVRLSVVGVHEASGERPEQAKQQKKERPEHPLVTEARQTGIFSAFEQALSQVEPSCRPSDPARHFVTWLSKAQRIKSPQFAIKLCLPEDEREGTAELYTFGMMSAVLMDGSFRAFLPTTLIKGDAIQALGSTNGTLHAGDRIDLQTWVRTRYGYVANRGVMFSEMRQRCIGDFDTANKK